MDAAHRAARRIGQLVAGIILGPSVFGTIWPSGQQAIFPPSASDRQMLNAVSELGVLLLLLTGMETDLALVRRVRRSALITSAAGIVIPFACGYVLGKCSRQRSARSESAPAHLALPRSSAFYFLVKIVAAVLREVDYLRRNLGQIILAAAILDETIGWTILAFIGGLAAQNACSNGPGGGLFWPAREVILSQKIGRSPHRESGSSHTH